MAVWYYIISDIPMRSGIQKTHLVDTSRVTVEEHLHTVRQYLLRLLSGQKRPFAIDTRLVLIRLAQQRSSNVRTVTRCEGRCRVGGTEQIDKAEEAECQLCTT